MTEVDLFVRKITSPEILLCAESNDLLRCLVTNAAQRIEGIGFGVFRLRLDHAEGDFYCEYLCDCDDFSLEEFTKDFGLGLHYLLGYWSGRMGDRWTAIQPQLHLTWLADYDFASCQVVGNKDFKELVQPL